MTQVNQTAIGQAIQNAIERQQRKTLQLKVQPKAQAPATGSQMEVVWRFLKANPNPNTNYAVISTGTGIPQGSVSPVLTELWKRGMVSREPAPNDVSGRYLYQAVGSTYAVLPVQRQTPRTRSTVTRSTNRAFDLDNYTLGELRDIYTQLKVLFG